mmetsp:Transcript_32279/g.74572  ORF Transcript_32279/g.74572 Transcript_32279/m.74572 type:complete len:150 (+) Transcript_32279:27-476(+)
MADDLLQLSIRSQYGLSFRKFDATDFTANKLAAVTNKQKGLGQPRSGSVPAAMNSESRDSFRILSMSDMSLWRGKADPRENESLCHDLGHRFSETTSSRDAYRSHAQKLSSRPFTLQDNLGLAATAPAITSTNRSDFRWPGKAKCRRGR